MLIKKHTVVVVDNDKAIIYQMEIMFRKIEDFVLTGKYTDSQKALEEITINPPDVLFLDIEMPYIDGIAFMKEITFRRIHTHVIIITAFEKRVLEAAHHCLIDYLVKPFCADELRLSLHNFRQHELSHSVITNFLNSYCSKIHIPTWNQDLFFSPDEIIYLEADGNYTKIHLIEERMTISSFNLGNIQRHLPSNSFLRISRKHVINYQYLNKIDRKNKECVLQLNHQGRSFVLPYSKSNLDLSNLFR